MAEHELLTAAQAAAMLGVTRQTLYAYVSRGRLGSQPGPGPSRARRYARADVEALLRARTTSPAERAAGEAMRWGTPVLDSALTLIADGRVFYRGHDAVRLSRTTSLEEVASLLWTDGRVAASTLFAEVPIPRLRRGQPPSLLGRMAAALRATGDDTLASGSSPEPAQLRAAAGLISRLFAAVGAEGDGPLAERLARGWGVRDPAAISSALVLCADHELNVSAFTARCIASADTKLEQVLLGALCAFQGRRHGGMGVRVQTMLDHAVRDGVEPALERVLAEQGEVPGFGHPLYPTGDPRAAELLRVAASPTPPDAVAMVQCTCRTRLGLLPNLDLGLAAVQRRCGLPADAGIALFALGRSVGWIAHAFETWHDRTFIRPRARYVGRAPDPT